MLEVGRVTVFKNIFDTTEPMFIDVVSIFKRIKEGNSKDIVEKIRAAQTKEEANEYKKRLPSICFSGRFGKREAEFLLEHSGLICLDVDDLSANDLPKVKEIMCADSYVFGCFVSPSGNGLKIIVKIVPNKEEHRGQFLALEEHFNKMLNGFVSTKKNEKTYKGVTSKIDDKQGDYLKAHIDKSGKDVNRVCYESFDADVYYFEDSDIWAEVKEVINEVRDVDVEDENTTIQLLQIWIDKQESYHEGNRNNYLTKFIFALCRFGITPEKTKQYLLAQFQGLPVKDVEAMIKSCYKTGAFGTQSFSKKELQSKTMTSKIKLAEDVAVFWSINDKGRVKIDVDKFLRFVQTNGFGLYKKETSDENWLFVKIENMIVDVVTVVEIKQIVLDFCMANGLEMVVDELQMKNRYFEKTFLNALPFVNVEQIRDRKDCIFFFFEGFYYEITADKKERKQYIDLEGKHIWRSQLCRHTITEEVDFRTHDFVRFVYRAMGEDADKYHEACAALGYWLHTYKKKSLARLV
jgi:hypothetical protein